VSNPFSLEGRRAIVTGANTGIGQAIAVGLAQAGAHVICAGRRGCDETVALIKDAKGTAETVLVDFANPMAGQSLFAGRDVDILVNNAGIIRRADAVDFTEEDSFQGGIRVPSYTASKHGVSGITKLLANEWAEKGINVNAVAPGYIETNNTEALRADPDRNAAILDRIPAGRWGEASDIAGAAVYLCTPAAGYIHGATLNVDGGWLAR